MLTYIAAAADANESSLSGELCCVVIINGSCREARSTATVVKYISHARNQDQVGWARLKYSGRGATPLKYFQFC